MSAEPEPKKPRLEGDASDFELADFPPLPVEDDSEVSALATMEWDSGLATVTGKQLAERRLAALQALQQLYRKQMRWVEAAYGTHVHALDAAHDTAMTDPANNDSIACFSDLEEDCPDPAPLEKLVAERQAFAAALPGIDRLERLSTAASMREMAAQGAAAALVGRSGRFFIRSTCVTLGRTNGKGGPHVDVDLSMEAKTKASNKISRQQAVLELQNDGAWHLTNIGRGRVSVNACPLPRGDVALAPHLSLLEFGSARMLLLANPVAVCRGGMGFSRRW